MERDEVHRMPGAHGDADLARLLGAADPGSVAGARVDDHEWSHLRIDHDAWLWLDTEQHVVDRPLERAAIDHQLVVEHQDRRLAPFIMLDRLVAALAHDVPEQDVRWQQSTQ